jgi:hypothetical protein
MASSPAPFGDNDLILMLALPDSCRPSLQASCRMSLGIDCHIQGKSSYGNQ